MPYFYGITDEKYVRSHHDAIKKLNPLDSHAFKLSPLLQGKQRIRRGETSIRYKTSPDTLVELCSPVVNAIPLPQPFKWRHQEVADWIRKLGFPQYQNTFRRNYINGHTLLRMDASYLVKINIKDFDHIRIITNSIRKLYGIERSSFNRSISRPDRTPDALYKFYRIKTGTKYADTRRTDLYRTMHLLRPPPLYETHWQLLERWLKHRQPIEIELIGGTIRKRYNLFYPRKAKPVPPVKKRIPIDCNCIPPCLCEWSQEKDLRARRKLKCLQNVSDEEKLPVDSVFNTTRSGGWPDGQQQKCITLLEVHIPHKYLHVSDMRLSGQQKRKVHF